MEFVRAQLDDPLYHHVSSVIARSCLCPTAGFTQPVAKASSFLNQQSPMGHTRLVAEPESIEAHMAKALKVTSDVRREAWSRSSRDLTDAILFVAAHVDDPASLLLKRSIVKGIMQWASMALQPLTDKLFAFAPAHVRSLPTRHHIALIASIADAMHWPHKDLPACLLFGSPTTGLLPPTGLFRPNPKWATIDPATFDCKAWADELEKRIARTGKRSTKRARDMAAVALEKSVDETRSVVIDGVDTGRSWACGPFDRLQVDALFPKGFWPNRRFPVLQKGDVRPCDDCRESEQNAATSTLESISCDGADFPAAIADMFYSLLGTRSALGGGTDDWKKAYRQAPNSDPSRSVVAQWDPVKKCVVYFVLYGHCFGQVAAVNSFNALSKFLTCASRTLFASVSGNYFDDHCNIEPLYTAGSGQYAVVLLAGMMGFLFDANKHVPVNPVFVYLGVSHDLRRVPEGFVSLCILPKRRAMLVDACRAVLRKGRLSHGDAASLRGKLYFAATTAYGRVGRAALQPILQRQERDAGRASLTPALVRALSFFITLLNNMPDREISLGSQGRPPILVWSDASWEGGIGRLGFVVYDPDTGAYFESDSDVPQFILDFFVAKKQKIGQCEILAATAVYSSLPDLFRRRRVIHWIDNTSAISCLIHGYSGKPDSALLVNAFHLFNAGLRADVHFEYVESKSNVADLPSRGEFLYVREVLGARRVEFEFHNYATWHGPLRAFLTSSVLPADVRKRPRSKSAGASRNVRRKAQRASARASLPASS